MTPPKTSIRASLVLDPIDAFQAALGLVSGPRPLGPLTLELLARKVGDAFVPFEPAWELETLANPEQFRLFYNRIKIPTPRGGRRMVAVDLEEGTYRIRASAGFYQDLVTEVDLPRPEKSLTLELMPAAAYVFPARSTTLRDTELTENKEPIAGAVISAPGALSPCRTLANGDWVLAFTEFTEDKRVTVTVTRPNPPPLVFPDVLIRHGQQNRLRAPPS